MISNFVLTLSQAKNQPAGSDLEIVLCPPTIYLQKLQTALTTHSLQEHFMLGAQNIYCESSGAFTGEIAPEMLVDIGGRTVIIGHSERRLILGERDEQISRKFAAAQSCGLVPVLCIGESLEQRQAGKTLEVVAEQLGSVIEELGVGAFARAVVAYEPVWAIGTGLTASSQQAQEVHAAIRAQLAAENAEVARGVRILYGGSVKAANAAELFGMPDIDGGLIGGASLNADEFGAICRAAGN